MPDGYFSVMGELFKHLYNLEALFHRSLDERAMIEISIELRWAKYARKVLNISDQHRCKYAHIIRVSLHLPSLQLSNETCEAKSLSAKML